MLDSLTCGVCGHSVDPGGDHTQVDVLRRRIRDRDDVEEYVLHDRCAQAAFEGWRQP